MVVCDDVWFLWWFAVVCDGLRWFAVVCLLVTDMPQFRGGNPYFFSENLYQSVSFIDASMYRDMPIA